VQGGFERAVYEKERRSSATVSESTSGNWFVGFSLDAVFFSRFLAFPRVSSRFLALHLAQRDDRSFVQVDNKATQKGSNGNSE
jgi:hypothetical protein